jgi:hypothetical protein
MQYQQKFKAPDTRMIPDSQLAKEKMHLVLGRDGEGRLNARFLAFA